MSDAAEHYRSLLASVYAWSVGGFDAALERQRESLRAANVGRGDGRSALDLGAGFGATAIALAELGWDVTAVDTSEALLCELESRRGKLPIRVERRDLVEFVAVSEKRFDLVLCLGDTLTHLASFELVDELFRALSAGLAPGGTLRLAFRDYVARTPEELERFILVRGDERRVLTCFLEPRGDRIVVHDLLHEFDGFAWRMQVSAYPKLRLAPDRVVAQLAAHGFALETRAVERGMTTLVARRL
ncbi:MAG: class I SAM-dependent methyltransferase [Planctomycetes bacterium]|nr:class I SAM-dependent methyltransferase [Planctomycetota bacterium]